MLQSEECNFWCRSEDRVDSCQRGPVVLVTLEGYEIFQPSIDQGHLRHSSFPATHNGLLKRPQHERQTWTQLIWEPVDPKTNEALHAASYDDSNEMQQNRCEDQPAVFPHANIKPIAIFSASCKRTGDMARVRVSRKNETIDPKNEKLDEKILKRKEELTTENYRKHMWKRLKMRNANLRVDPNNCAKKQKTNKRNKPVPHQDLEDFIKNVKVNRHKHNGKATKQHRISSKPGAKNIETTKRGCSKVSEKKNNHRQSNCRTSISNKNKHRQRVLSKPANNSNGEKQRKCSKARENQSYIRNIIQEKSQSKKTAIVKPRSCQTHTRKRRERSMSPLQYQSRLEYSWSSSTTSALPQKQMLLMVSSSSLREMRNCKKDLKKEPKTYRECYDKITKLKTAHEQGWYKKTGQRAFNRIKDPNILQRNSSSTLQEMYITCRSSNENESNPILGKRITDPRKNIIPEIDQQFYESAKLKDLINRIDCVLGDKVLKEGISSKNMKRNNVKNESSFQNDIDFDKFLLNSTCDKFFKKEDPAVKAAKTSKNTKDIKSRTAKDIYGKFKLKENGSRNKSVERLNKLFNQLEKEMKEKSNSGKKKVINKLAKVREEMNEECQVSTRISSKKYNKHIQFSEVESGERLDQLFKQLETEMKDRSSSEKNEIINKLFKVKEKYLQITNEQRIQSKKTNTKQVQTQTSEVKSEELLKKLFKQLQEEIKNEIWITKGKTNGKCLQLSAKNQRIVSWEKNNKEIETQTSVEINNNPEDFFKGVRKYLETEESFPENEQVKRSRRRSGTTDRHYKEVPKMISSGLISKNKKRIKSEELYQMKKHPKKDSKCKTIKPKENNEIVVKKTRQIKFDKKFFGISDSDISEMERSNCLIPNYNKYPRKTNSEHIWNSYTGVLAADKSVFNNHVIRASKKKNTSLEVNFKRITQKSHTLQGSVKKINTRSKGISKSTKSIKKAFKRKFQEHRSLMSVGRKLRKVKRENQARKKVNIESECNSRVHADKIQKMIKRKRETLDEIGKTIENVCTMMGTLQPSLLESNTAENTVLHGEPPINPIDPPSDIFDRNENTKPPKEMITDSKEPKEVIPDSKGNSMDCRENVSPIKENEANLTSENLLEKFFSSTPFVEFKKDKNKTIDSKEHSKSQSTLDEVESLKSREIVRNMKEKYETSGQIIQPLL